MNNNASNALLKILEEPSTNLFFILIHNSHKKLISTINSRCIKFNFFITESEKEKIINNVLDGNFYEGLSYDFKIRYLSPKFYIDLYDFINKEKIELNELDIGYLLNYIFNKRNYLKDEFIIENLQILIEIYFYNKIISRNNFENDYKSFKQTINKINNMNLSYHIYYSKKYKLYDLVIKNNNEFFANYHISSKKELIKLINNKNYDYKKDQYSSYEIQ